ncbi:MAG: hypothetical protein LBU88_02680 [Treponema sp.]|jgi:hypothetical protein|nr:hypothetical protein [Treponema sp.]
MNKKYLFTIILLLALIFTSCLGQRKSAIVPIPDTEFFDFTLLVKMENITESKGGSGTRNLPLWLRTYINGGIEETEKIETYNGKYLFIGMSEGLNFTAMNKWAENFSPVRDTAIIAAGRIEKKLVASASLYPDNEYGDFFETIIKKAYSAVYTGAVKEDAFWIKIKVENETREIYVFFVLISIDKNVFHSVVQDMMAKSMPESSFTRNQRSAVNRLQQNFFEGF